MSIDWMLLRKKLNSIGWLFGVGLFLYQTVLAYLSLDGYSFESLDLQWLILTFLAIGAAILMQILIWKAILNHLSASIEAKTAITTYTASFFHRYIPGGIWGYVSRNEVLNREYKIDTKKLTIASLAELVLIPISGIFWVFSFRIGLNFIVPFVIIVILVYYVIKFGNARNQLSGVGIFYVDGGFLLPLKFIILVFIMYCFFWFLQGLGLWLAVASLTGHFFSNPAKLTMIFAQSWLMGFFFLFSPSGLGIRESVMYTLLADAGLETHILPVIAIMFRVVGFLAEATWVFIGRLIMPSYAN